MLDEKGYMAWMPTARRLKGIYGAGDVIAKPLRQVVTAANDGAIAAQHAFHEIRGI